MTVKPFQTVLDLIKNQPSPLKEEVFLPVQKSKALLKGFLALAGLIVAAAGAVNARQATDAVFGRIPDSLFQMNAPAGVPYLITNKEVDISFKENDSTVIAILKHHVRLKIFDETAREASIVSIPYYFDNRMEQISDIEAVTHLPSGESIPLKVEEIKTINLNPRYNLKEFTMPRVEDGAVLEYRYTIRRRYIEELPDFYLSHTVPVAVANLTITYPPYLRYKIFVENYEGPVQQDSAFTDTSSVPRVFTIPRPPPVLTRTITVYDIPAVEDEPFVPSLNDYRGKIKFLMSEFGLPRQPLENSWEVVVAKLRREANPLKQVRDNRLAFSLGDSIAGANSGSTQKAVQDSIYRYLNKRMNFSGQRAPYAGMGDTAVLAGQPAGQAAINQTLLAMLRGAGIEAYPVFVSTRPSGKINKHFPSFLQFNSLMIRSVINGETFIMDASMPFSLPDLIPVPMNNVPGLLLKRDSFEWLEFEAEKSVFDIRVEVEAELQSNGTLSGRISSIQRGYPAQVIRRQKTDGVSDTEIFKRMLLDGFSGVTVEKAAIKNVNEYDEPVEMAGQFIIERYAASFSDGLRFRPMLVGALAENPFENKERALPVTFDAPEELDISYTISLPSQYEFRQGIQNRALSIPGADLEESYAVGENELKYEFHIDISRTRFGTAYFPQLYKLYERWVELSHSAWMIQK